MSLGLVISSDAIPSSPGPEVPVIAVAAVHLVTSEYSSKCWTGGRVGIMHFRKNKLNKVLKF